MGPYRDELEAAQLRNDALENDVEEQAEQIEKLRAAVKNRDVQLDKLRAKFDGAPAAGSRTHLLRRIAMIAALVSVVGIFVLQFRPSGAQSPAETFDEIRTSEPGDAASVAPTSTLTLADPLDPPVPEPESDELPDASAVAPELRLHPFAKLRALQDKVAFGQPTEADVRALRDMCLDLSNMECARDARRKLQQMRGEKPAGGYDEMEQRQALEVKAWSGDATENEIRMLRAICSNQGDMPCRNRAHQLLKQMQRKSE